MNGVRSQPPKRARGLVDEVLSGHRLTAAALAVMLVLSLLTSGYLILIMQPRVVDSTTMTRLAREGRESMLDEETGLRGWLATGDPEFLEPYESGRLAGAEAFDGLADFVDRVPDAADEVVSTLVARERWQAWAARAATTRLAPREKVDGTLTRFLLEGKDLFDAYRTADTASLNLIKDHRDRALAAETRAMVGTLIAYLTLLLTVGGIFWYRRRRVRARLLDPIHDLLACIDSLQRGDLSARSQPTAVPELSQIGRQLDDLAGALEVAGSDAAKRERQLALMAERLATVVRVGREISGSLSVRYVAASVTEAASDLMGATSTMWVRTEDQVFHAVRRSADPHGVLPPADVAAPDVVVQAAADARPVSTPTSRAYPLVLAGAVTGVLEVDAAQTDPNTEQVLDALLSTAAVALESAHLHSAAREMADMDALTSLPNRRRLEVDIDAEWDRSLRYGRPLSLVMIDLDHFKALNDAHGHLVGDVALREVAAAITRTLRTSDTAYRFGGEELVVLLRETGLEDAASCAERIRVAIAQTSLAGHPGVRVTASAGVATRDVAMAHHSEMTARADAALYSAKRHGRNRVVTAEADELGAFETGADETRLEPRAAARDSSRPEIGSRADSSAPVPAAAR